MDVLMRKKEQSENVQGMGEVLEMRYRQSGIQSVQTAQDMLSSQSGFSSEGYAEEGAVPQFASAPAHLDAHLRTDFETALDFVINNIDNSILSVTNNPDIEAALKTLIMQSLIAIKIYAEQRRDIFNDSSPIGFVDIEQAYIFACKNLNTALITIADKRDIADRELQSAESSLRWSFKQETKRTASANVVKKDKRLKLCKSLESELEPYREFLWQDNYSGTLVIHEVYLCEDSEILLPGTKSTTNSVTGTITEETFSYEDRTDELLFKKPPAVEDLHQGKIGDCYLIAGLASIVATDPSLITGAMKDVGAEVYVRFFKDFIPIFVRVKKTVPIRTCVKRKSDGTSSEPEASDAFAHDFLWVQMIEKAYAASGLCKERSYEGIEEGESDIFVSHMTGKAHRRIQMSSDENTDEGNSLIGAYKNRYSYMEGKNKTVNIRLASLIRADYLGVPATVLQNAARGIYMRHSSAGISVEDAVQIALKMAENEDSHKVDYSYVDAAGETKSGRRLTRASFLDELTHIVGAATISVPSTHDLVKTVLDRLIIENPISLSIAQQAGSESDTRKPIDLTPLEELALRIRSLYAKSHVVINHDDSITLAQAYEVEYRKQIAADMIKLLKKDDEMRLSYSPFYVRKSKTGEDKHRYTHKAMSIFKIIEENINRGNILTAGTVGFAREGDRYMNSGLVESHAYSVLGTEEASGVRYIKLLNPWSHYVRSYDPENGHQPIEDLSEGTQGIFLLELNDFVSNYNLLRINSSYNPEFIDQTLALQFL